MSHASDSASESGQSAPYKLDDHDPIIQSLAPLLVQSAYACGGSILVKKRTKTSDEGITSPVTIRWDSAELIKKLTLPPSAEITAEVAQTTVQSLVESTQPASFGFEGRDVIDESYRKASKLEPSAFSTNFCPYAAGIIDTIGQTLLPLPTSRSQGIRAELYKLNIYEGPSGMFKAHLDTPRSDLHFGSLVVCLPCAHEGGQLIVRHQGHSTTFDWSRDNSNIQWAAFYGDCEHEVSQVTSGHRITLTYNLFLRRGLGEMAGSSPALDVTQLPAFKEVEAALGNPLFFPDGGYLAKYCSHAYAHATDEGIHALPAILKGSDMVTYEVFRALGIQVQVRPTLDYKSKWRGQYFDEEFFEHDRFGKKLTGPIQSDNPGDDCGVEELFDQYPEDQLKVKWLNVPTAETENMQYAYITYGNQAELDWSYSFCVLLMSIPPHSERTKPAKKCASTHETNVSV